MKYLKLFESHEELFKRISANDFYEELGEGKLSWEGLKREVYEIEDYVRDYNRSMKNPNMKLMMEIDGDKLTLRDQRSHMKNQKGMSGNKAILIYYNNDEWYYVCVSKYNDGPLDFYKCDQWDGLLECLEYIKKGNSL